jgi:aminoglycoside phosphotransferase (APT) family kinase protein
LVEAGDFPAVRAATGLLLRFLTATLAERSKRTDGQSAAAAARRLASLPPVVPVPIHRDLHDKQVLVEPGGGIGVLDFDTLALGDPALDLGNLLAHLDLRALQHRCSEVDAERLGAALLDGYGTRTTLRERAAAYAQATRVRLACVYAFRPSWPGLPDQLLRQ